MKKKELLGYGILIILGVLGLVAMICRSEQIDTKKELPVARQSNSVNF
jgi:hypothetical protein